ncbi:MAG: DEAD/DEAH box helicase [Bacteroidales bacterium]
MSKEFVIILSKSKLFGWMLKPYFIQKEKDFYNITDSILAENYSSEHFTDIQNELIKLASQCTEKEITKLFSREKLSIREFISNLKDENLISNIREYIEKRLIKSFELLKNEDINVFYKSESKKLFEEDKLKIVKSKTKAVFNFTRELEASKYFLSINDGISDVKLLGKPGEIISNSPCILLSDYKLYFFSEGADGIDGKKLLPFFTRDSILIPKNSEKKYFETFVKNAIENYEVRNTGFEIEYVNLEPEPYLFLENDWKQEFVIVLKFKYDSAFISFAKNKSAFVEFYDTNGVFKFRKIIRNYEFEKEILDYLSSSDELEEANSGCFKLKKDLKGESTLINWVNSHTEFIQKRGIIINQNFYNKKYFTKKIVLDFKLREKRDWFDLQAIVKFGDFEVPFIRLKNNLITRNPEFVLPNGEIAIIPEEWFTKYTDLINFSKKDGDNLLISKAHIPFFYEELSGINKTLVEKAYRVGHEISSLPAGLSAELRPYQVEGFNWIWSLFSNKLGSCLADDMGLGKTLQTLAVILKLKQDKDHVFPVSNHKELNTQLSLFDLPVIQQIEHSIQKAGIIIMPTSLIHNWKNEICKFAPELKFYEHSGTRRIKSTGEFDGFDIVLTSYGVLRNDIEILKKYSYRFLILDESQYIKNPESKIYQAVIELNADFKMVLTGTPIENSLNDLWAQINFINPGLLGGLEFFKKEFADPIEHENDVQVREVKQAKLKKLIHPFILRRTKMEVLSELPELTETVKYCCMLDEQRKIYEKEISKIRNSLINVLEIKDKAEANLIVIQGLTKLRQLANHPKMLEGYDDTGSGKFDDVVMMLESLLAENHKVLIFSSFVKHLNLFAGYLDKINVDYSMLTGSTLKREEEIRKFQGNAECNIFLISLKAGGVGLNLTAADYVFFLDPWWNPASENQALSRAHRMGQKNKVMVYRFITENSIEEKIIKLQEWKKELADVFVNSNNPFLQMTENEILDLFS